MKKEDEDTKSKEKYASNVTQIDYAKFQPFIEEIVNSLF
jgi:hypothetical protein